MGKQHKQDERTKQTRQKAKRGDQTESAHARVVAVHRDAYEISSADGLRRARLKRGGFSGASGSEQESTCFPVVGDYVQVLVNPYGEDRIVRVHPRSTVFRRADLSGHADAFAKTVVDQVLAANMDTVFIFAALNNDFHPDRIRRYLAATLQSGARPVVLLTKADLAGDVEEKRERVARMAPDVSVHAVSAHTGEGMDALSVYVRDGCTIALLGSSGTGKSTLLNALAGEPVMDTGAIREADSKGRHTTTHRQLVYLPCGAAVIDTPGLREIGLWDAEEGLKDAFPAVTHLADQCRFSDCTHTAEPGCAVRRALDDGTLDPHVWQQYRKLSDEEARHRRRAPGKRKGQRR